MRKSSSPTTSSSQQLQQPFIVPGPSFTTRFLSSHQTGIQSVEEFSYPITSQPIPNNTIEDSFITPNDSFTDSNNALVPSQVQPLPSHIPVQPMIQLTPTELNQESTFSSSSSYYPSPIYNHFLGNKSFIHLNDMNSDMDDAPTRKYRCDVLGCRRSFKRSGHLKRHKVVHVPQKERRRFHCDNNGCDKHYSTKYDLAAHSKQVHQGYKLFKCLFRGCSRRFVKKESLDKHLSHFDHEALDNGISNGNRNAQTFEFDEQEYYQF